MSEQYTVTVPVPGPDGQIRYTQVGMMSPRQHHATGEVVYAIKLDFPVGATELVAFPIGSGAAMAQERSDAAVKFAGTGFEASNHDRPTADTS